MATLSAPTSSDSPPRSSRELTGARTCCSNCRTVFEVAPELLSSTDTRVRCGECFAIFDAAANLENPDSGKPPQTHADEARRGSAEHGDAKDGVNSVARSDMASYGQSTDGSIDDTGDRNGDHTGGYDRVVPKRGLGDGSDVRVGDDAGAHRGDEVANEASADHAELDVTYSDFDLFSEDADLPEIAYFDQTRDTPEFDFDSVALENDETFSETLFSRDVTIDADSFSAPRAARGSEKSLLAAAAGAGADLSNESQEADGTYDPIVFQYRDPEPGDTAGDDQLDGDTERVGREAIPLLTDLTDHAQSEALAAETLAQSTPESLPDSSADSAESATSQSAPATDPAAIESTNASGGHSLWLASFLVLVLAVILSALYGWRHRDTLHNDARTRPLYELYCRATGCDVPTRVSLDDLRLTKRNVYSHPDIDDALAIDVTFRNQADFDQRFPVLVVRFSDSSGRLVARRAFQPDEYIRNWQQTDTIRAGAQRDISLDVKDPGDNASSFEVDFQAAQWVGAD